jgi:hypothetical protein
VLEEAIKELSSAIRVWTEALMRNNQLVEQALAAAVPPAVKLPAPALEVKLPAPATRTVKTERGTTITGLPLEPAAPPAVEAPVAAHVGGGVSKPEAALTIPYADVRAAIIAFHKEHGNDGLKALLAPYGATKGQELKPEQYADVLAAIAKSALEVA